MPGERASSPVAGIVLAAGVSSRMGRNKMFIEIGGETLLRRAVRVAAGAGLSPVVVVLGHEADRAGALPALLRALAAQTNTTVDSGYHASLYAFNLLKSASFTPGSPANTRNLVSTAPLAGANLPSIWPVHGQVMSGFGERLDPLDGEGAFHAGMDIAAPTGTDVIASADGIVLSAGPDAGYGNSVLIDHGYGIQTRYGHLSHVEVVVGQEVKRGQIIGEVGMTGRATGPHLHYEVHVQDTPVNPAKYMHG